MSFKDERAKAERIQAAKAKRAKLENKKREHAEQSAFDNELHSAEKLADVTRRCGALTDLVKNAPDDKVTLVADKALQAARETGDTYQCVTAATRVVFALIERDETDAARKALADLRDEARQIEPPPSKIETIGGLLAAACRLGDVRVKRTVLGALLAVCSTANTWRAGRMMENVVWVVADENKAEAQRIIDTMPENWYKRRAQKQINA